MRYAACVSTRSLLEWLGDGEDREALMPVLLPPMCLNRCGRAVLPGVLSSLPVRLGGNSRQLARARCLTVEAHAAL